MNGTPAGDPAVRSKLLEAVDRLGRALRSARRAVATDLGVSTLGLDVLELLRRHPHLAVGAIASELAVRQPTASDALRALEARSLVTRRAPPGDGRVRRVALTAEGARLAAEAASRLATMLGDTDPGADHTTPGAPAPAPAAPETDAPGSSAPEEVKTAHALEVLLGQILRLHRAGVITVDRSCLSCRHFVPSSGDSPARCELLGTELVASSLRVDCGEHSPAAA